MELTQITFKKGNLIIEMEENRSGGYSISINKEKAPEDCYERPICTFRTDEVMIEDLIEALTFSENYNFIQEK